MRILFYKIFYKLSVWCFPCKTRSFLIHKYCKEQIVLYNKDQQLVASTRQKTYPKVPKDSRLPLYTDYFER